MKLNPKWRNVSGIIILLTLAAWGLYDLIPASTPQEGDTLSEVINQAPAPWILFGGYLIGHFWPIKSVLRQIWQPIKEPGKKDD